MGKRGHSWSIAGKPRKAQRRPIPVMHEEMTAAYDTGFTLAQMTPEDSMGMFPTYSEAEAALQRTAGAEKGGTWRFRREACCACGAQFTPQWRSGPGGPRTLCNACGVRHSVAAKRAAQEPGAPAAPARRACLGCGLQRSPTWRSGPHGRRTLCNACGLRYIKGQPPFCAEPRIQETAKPPCSKCGAQSTPAWRGGPGPPQTLCEECCLRCWTILPLAAPLPGAQEPGVPAEPMQGQLSTEATAEVSGPVSGTEEAPEDMPASHNPGFPELLVELDSSDGEDLPTSAEEDPEPAIGARHWSEAHKGPAAQLSAALADHQGQHDQEKQQSAFRAAPWRKDAQADWEQQASADSVVMQRRLQGQINALMPLLRMLGPLSMLAARQMPPGKLQYSKVEALIVGMVYGLVASRAVILHSILRERLVGNEELQRLLGYGELQHQTWVLAVTLATGQSLGSGGDSGHALGHQASRQALADLEHPSPHLAAWIPASTGSPSSKQTTKMKRAVSEGGGIASSPSPSQACNNAKRQACSRQAAAGPDTSGCNEAAREAGRLGQPRAVKAQAVQRARPHSLSQAAAAASEEQQQAGMPRHANAAKHGTPLLQLPGQPQPCRQLPMPASSTHVQQAQEDLSARPEAHSTSLVLPPPEKEFLLLQSVLMPVHDAMPASAPSRHLDEGLCTNEDEEEVAIAEHSPDAKQPSRHSEPDQALQQRSDMAGQPPAQHAYVGEESDTVAAYAQAEVAVRQIFSDPAPQQAVGMQGPPTIVLLDSGGLVEGEGGELYDRDVYSFREDHTERMLDLRAVAKAVGWDQLFSSSFQTKDLCAVLWTLITQQAAREGYPQYLLSEAPKEHTISLNTGCRKRFLLRLSQIQTLYWISDELERGRLDAFCKGVWEDSVYECSMQSVKVYEAQDAGHSGQERAGPASARGVNALYASIGRGGASAQGLPCPEKESAPQPEVQEEVSPHAYMLECQNTLAEW